MAAVAMLLTGLSVSAVSSKNDDPRQLQERIRQAFDEEDWPAAIEAGTRLARAQPAGGVAAYNVACAYSRSGDTAGALKWLGESARLGFAITRLLNEDPDLAAVRDEDGFAEIVERVERNRREEFEWFSNTAREAEPLVILPDGYDPEVPAPLIIVLHGRGDSGKSIARAWDEVANETGAILVAPDALRPLWTGYEWRFVDESVWYVLLTLDRVRERYSVDEQRIVLTGFSQGAHVALVTALRHPERFCGLVPVSGDFDPRLEVIPPAEDGPTPRVWLLIGSEDRSAQSYREAHKAFRAAGWTAKLRIEKGLGHVFPVRDRKELRKVLNFVCGL
jgi:predicted esterase